ncbi:MAG: carbamoyltransferase C-terminal domain-containing protein [Chthoniobacterales bacterium]|jgi:carbamoyltransferase
MNILGISGGPDPAYPTEDPLLDVRMHYPWHYWHDSAAVMVCDGKVVVGIEEERLSRTKHTNKLPLHAIRYCLRAAGLSFDDIDRLAYYVDERYADRMVRTYVLQNPRTRVFSTGREFAIDLLNRHLNWALSPERFVFVEHHLAHATSAFAMAPYNQALVVTLDGVGDGLAGTVYVGEGCQLTRIFELQPGDSLGLLYMAAIEFLGYRLFDEYKVMGLAPYGDPTRFRPIFEQICVLQPEGRFSVNSEKLTLLDALGPPRRTGEPFTEVHRDLAAALQDTIERAVFHHLIHYKDQTRLGNLCLAGGVAHNSTLVGKLLRSRLFDSVFVQPAAHDAGCALGAALSVHKELAPDKPIEALSHLYWGTDLGISEAVFEELLRWKDLVEIRPVEDPSTEAADLIAEGKIIGWAQGRSEFGPRALGNRSILADPRRAENKDLINEMVKNREWYRPFAPSVLEEYAGQFFEVPDSSLPAYMTFTVPVRDAMRAKLAAVTHIDGTARIQTVSRNTNERYWRLIEAFRQRTGVPVVLNTSFNHNLEPIVDSVEDSMTCFLTTGLTHLIIDNYLVTKRPVKPAIVSELFPTLPEHVQLVYCQQVGPGRGLKHLYRFESTVDRNTSRPVGAATYKTLTHAIAWNCSLGAALACDSAASSHEKVCEELYKLWVERLIRLVPRSKTSVKVQKSIT